jgi:anti-sigma factor RsiW
MRCEECQSLIEGHFDGELDASAVGLVAGHLATCASCARAYRKLEREQDFYFRHESDVEASPAFWSGVFAKAAQDRCEEAAARSGWNLHSLWERFAWSLGKIGAIRFGPLSTAAMVLITIGVTAGVMKYIYSRERVSERAVSSHPPRATGRQMQPEDLAGSKVAKAGEPQVVDQTRGVRSEARQRDQKPAADRRRQAPEELVREAEQKYLAAIALLSRDANRRRPRLDSESLAQFDQTLAAVDRTIADTRRAVRGRPDDPIVVQYMLAAYAKKVEVLKQMIDD